MTRPMASDERHWAITVHDWGTLYAIGTEAHAEEWRRHKARWERAVARKRVVDPSESATWRRLDALLGYAGAPKWWNCRTHGRAQEHTAWGCPECVDELRAENAALRERIAKLESELAALLAARDERVAAADALEDANVPQAERHEESRLTLRAIGKTDES